LTKGNQKNIVLLPAELNSHEPASLHTRHTGLAKQDLCFP
jgi:hypothetical protein